MRIIILLLVALLATPTFADATSQVLDDAKIILNSKKDTIKKWEFTPSIVLVADPARADVTQAKVSEVFSLTPLDAPELTVLAPPVQERLGRFPGDIDFLVDGVESGTITGQLTIGETVARGHIFVFSVSDVLAARLMIETHFTRSSTSLDKRYFDGESGCFYRNYSNAKSILFGFIFINHDLSAEAYSRCFHVEFYQIMGLSNDSPNSKHFSFEKQRTLGDRPLDRKLLRALYDQSIVHGDPVDDVIRVFETMLREE